MTKRPGLLARYRRVLKNDAAAGIVLMIAAAAALVWSNSPWREAYERLATTVVGPGSVHLALPIEHWASDGILTVFFFVVGLELKQEKFKDYMYCLIILQFYKKLKFFSQ